MNLVTTQSDFQLMVCQTMLDQRTQRAKLFGVALFLIAVSSFSTQVSYAAGKVHAHKIDKNMRLAMLQLQQGSILRQQVKRSTLKTVSKSKPRPKKITVFPHNCLTWNVSQIDAKAKSYKETIDRYARQFKVDRNLIKSVITAESCFNKTALSSAGAQGLMQLIPETAVRFGVTNSYDPQQNIRAGVQYLRFLLDRFKGNVKLTIAAYNAGEGAVEKYNGIPPYKETQQYVKNVLKVYALLNPNYNKKRVKAVYKPPRLGKKPGRYGWQYNRSLAPHLYKQR